MSKDDELEVPVNLNVRYKTGHTGLLVGYFAEFPFITGQGKTLKDLVDKLGKDLAAYSNTFPEGKKKLFELMKVIQDKASGEWDVTAVTKEETQLKQGWTQEMIECVIPSSTKK
jgi:hypothetical protein